MTNLLFEPPFGGIKGNGRTSSIARRKARVRLPIRDHWTFFASSYAGDVISKYWSKSALFGGRGSLWALILGRRAHHPPTIVGIRKLECFCYLTVKITWSYLHSSGYNTSMWRTCGRTDGRNCRSYYNALHCKQCGRAVKNRTIFDICYLLI